MTGTSADAILLVLGGFPAVMVAYYWFGRLVINRHTTRRESRLQRARHSAGPEYWNPWSAIPLPPDDDQLARQFAGTDHR